MSTPAIDTTQIRGLSFSGGGLAGILHLFFAEAVQQQGLLDQIDYFSGTSAGAIAALLISLGIPLETIQSELIGFKLNQLFDFKFTHLIKNFEENYGADSGEYCDAVIMDLMARNGFDPRMTMAEHFDLTRKYLLVVTTNVNSMTEIVITKDSHPDLSFVRALRMSMSIPLLFTSEELNGVRTCDGALSGANLPQAQTLAYMSRNGLPDTSICLAHAIIPSNFSKVTDISTYLSNIFNKFSAIPYTYDKPTTIETDIGKHSILDDFEPEFLRQKEIEISQMVRERLA